MLDQQGALLYVGKAKHLQKRLKSYFRTDVPLRIQTLTRQINTIEITLTQNEKEALILEQNLIKSLKPKYNILLRDGKSYPYLWISDHPTPRLSLYRGRRHEKGQFFGPYPGVSALQHTLDFLQKTFQLRSCSDPFFNARVRPCLQYQIKRCTAPCVQHVSKEDYAKQVNATIEVLTGRHETALTFLTQQMELASQKEAYEEAALARDRLQNLRHMQQTQAAVGAPHTGDIWALQIGFSWVGLAKVSVEDGHVWDTQTFLHPIPPVLDTDDMLSAFLTQYYLALDPFSVPAIIFAAPLSKGFISLFETTFFEKKRKKIRLKPISKTVEAWYQLAQQNAHSVLERHQSQATHQKNRWEQFLYYFQLPPSATRLLCLDVSHSLGECTVVSCVILDEAIPQKALYRCFSIEESKGDDCYALKQGSARYYAYCQENQEKWPDAILVDGGKGQLNAIQTALEALGAPIGVLLAIAKGPTRKPGQETLWQWHESGIREAILKKDQPLFHLLQHIRNEAHKTALQRHRQQRLRKRLHSPLENISGVGPKRRQALLRYFGGYQGILAADVATLAQVPSISLALAEVIFQALREPK